MREGNWAGTYVYGASVLHEPASFEAAREIIARAPRIRVLGSRHSFSAIADSGELISLAGLPADVVVDAECRTVSCSGAVRYGVLAEALHAEGLALHNLASLPHISVAGAVATATHGSGDANGNLATAVAGLELVLSDGERLAVRRGDPNFDGLVVGLGSLGAVTRVTLAVEPAYEVGQTAYVGLEWDALVEHFDAIMAMGHSVSVFTLWGATAGDVWVKRRAGGDAHPDRLFGAVAATGERHPIPGIDPVHCTPQLGVPGRWADRLPHFRMGFVPSSGDEIQSEYLLARRDAPAAISALRALAGVLRPVLQISELRTVAADTLWMSPQYGRDTLAIHFTWVRDPGAVDAVLAEVEAALAPFSARPHWGKRFLAGAATIVPLYARAADFSALAEQLDPRGAFRNEWLSATLG